MHPANLIAVTTCWSLRRAWYLLLNQPADTRDRTALRSPAYGTRRALGGHADPTPTAADLGPATAVRTRSIAEHIRQHVDNAWWLLADANRHQPLPTGPALTTMIGLLAACPPDRATEAADYLTDADRELRAHLRLGADIAAMPGNPKCPACQQRRLTIHTSAPLHADRTIRCHNPKCRCTGPLCPCRMTVQAKRVAHIWPLTAVIPLT